MGRGKGGTPADRRRIADLESSLFRSESTVARQACEIHSLRAQLAESRKALLAGRWQLHRLQRVVFNPTPVNESLPHP